MVWASVGQIPLYLPDPALPPPGLGWCLGSGPFYRMRNEIGRRLLGKQLSGVISRVNKFRETLGLSPTWELFTESEFLFMQATTPSFEYPRSELPHHIHFIGPLFPEPPATTLPPWWDKLNSNRPVVLVSQGTLNKNPHELIVPAVKALANRHVLVIVTTANKEGSDIGISPLPDNVLVTSFVPYSQLMQKLSAVVTNGGYGTVQQALSHGLPLVLAGRTEDKGEVCARVAWYGAGISLETRYPSARRIARLQRRHHPTIKAVRTDGPSSRSVEAVVVQASSMVRQH